MRCRIILLQYMVLHVLRLSKSARQSCRCPYCDFEGSRDEASHTVNVIFNKPGKYGVRLTDYPPACATVNGVKSNKQVMVPSHPNCIHTSAPALSPLDHWLEFDLLAAYTIREIVLWRSIILEENEVDALRMKAIDITLDGEICFSYPGYYDKSMDDLVLRKVHRLHCDSPVTGRYVRIAKRREYGPKGSFHCIAICEVTMWVCGTGYYGDPDIGCKPCPSGRNCLYDNCDNYYGCSKIVYNNVAIKQPATQSSILKGGPNNAVDGILTAESGNDCTATDPLQDGLNNRWWRVDLQTMHKIFYVKITNRQDCCGEQLKRFTILVSRTMVDLSWNIHFDNVCHGFNGDFVTGETKRINCSQSLVGRYVAVVTHYPHILHFCEIRPYGYHVREIAAGENCNVLNEAAYCDEGTRCSKEKCKILFEGNCTGINRMHCIDGTTCEKGTCVLAVNSPCANSRDKCQTGAVCDVNSGYRCKWDFGRRCENSESCRSGTICDQLKECKLPILASCKNYLHHCQYRSFCEPASGFSCKWNLGDNCQHTNTCRTGLVCDHFRKCKIPLNNVCGRSSECIGGASCRDSRCFCENNNSSTCEPWEGRAAGPCLEHTKCVQHSTCTVKICRCDTGYQVSDELFSCKLSVGSSCIDSQQCVAGLICDQNICRVEAGNNCENSPSCKNGSHCDSGICKILPGEDCRKFENLCSLDSACENGICKLHLQETCNPANDLCQEGTVCSKTETDSSAICRTRPGQSCAGDRNVLCVTTAVCDKGDVCKLKLGQSCTGPFYNDCKSGTKCDRGKCRLYLGNNCSDDEDCETGTVCDPLYSQCRLEAGRPCAAPSPSDLCLAGAVCNNAGICICSGNGVTIQTGKKCEPASQKIGGACDASLANSNMACDDPLAQCVVDTHLRNSICQCRPGFEIERRNYTCGAGAGKVCRYPNITISCTTGLICDFNDYCALEAGQSCDGENRRWCKTGSICENGICKINFNQDCSGPNRHKCKSATVCDALFKCKFPQNAACSTSTVCVAGSTCVNGTCQCSANIAKPHGTICAAIDGVVTGRCSSSACKDSNAWCTQQNICQCSDGFSVQSSDLTCKVSVGITCYIPQLDCISGTTCDNLAERCYLQLGQYCGHGNENNCITGAVCDTDKECKLDFNEICNGPNIFHCRSGTSCDWSGVCKYGTKQLCGDSSQCVAGAVCVNSVCECSDTGSVPHGHICEPKLGYVGGFCDAAKTCHAKNSICIEGICRCDPGFVTSGDGFVCEQLLFAAARQEALSETSGTVSAVLLGMVAVALFAGCITIVLRSTKYEAQEPTVPSQTSAATEDRLCLPQLVDDNISTRTTSSSQSVVTPSETSDTSSAQSGDVSSLSDTQSDVMNVFNKSMFS